jgi:excisionase family DNA binding protein
VNRNVQAPSLITVKELANQLGVSLSTARKLCYSRTVATVKFNKLLMVPGSEVTRLIEENLTPAIAD